MKVGDKRYRVRDGWADIPPSIASSTVIKVTEKMVYVARGDEHAFEYRSQLPILEAENLTAATPRGAWLKYGMQQQAIIDKLEKKLAYARKQQEIAKREADKCNGGSNG